MENENLKQEKRATTIYNNLEFNMYYLPINNFKQKHYFNIISIIGQSRLGKFMKLDAPGHIEFNPDDEKLHRFPIITSLETYNRNKTNCIIYDLPVNLKNDGYYDKLFIYYTDCTKEPYYGYLAYNSQTKKSIHRYAITGKYDELTKVLNEFFNTLQNLDIYKFYNRQYDATHNKNGLTLSDCPTIKDYKNYLESQIQKRKKYEEI